LQVYTSDQIGLTFRIEPLHAKEHDGGTPIPGRSQVCVKVMVQSYTDARLVSCELQNLGVFGSMHSDVEDMNGVKPLLTKYGRRTRSEPLVEENSSHATRSVLKCSSSTAAAA
jgi:hypothetical protein